MSKVIWKDIPNYKGLYQASNDGRIRSFYKKEPKELKQRLSNAGYFRVQLFKNKKRKWISLHRLKRNSLFGFVFEFKESEVLTY